MRIQHNIMAMNAYRNYNLNTKALSGNLEKLSSGYKINRAGDDAAGLAISEKMRAQITGLDAAQKNVKDGISLVKTAEGAMQEIQDMLNRMDYLATQSANGTYDNEVDRANLQKEVVALKDEINRIADSANFNGIKLLDGSLDEKVYKADASVEKVEVGGNIDSDYVVESEGSKGKYTTSVVMGDWANIKADSSYEFTVALDDGTSHTVKLTAALEDNKDKADYGKIKYLVAEDGKKYELATAITNDGNTTITLSGAATAGDNVEKLQSALRKELEKTPLGDNFKITFNNADDANSATNGIKIGTITLESKEVGTSAPQVRAFDYATINENGVRTNGADMGVKLSQTPLDAGFEIDVSKLTEYNGENADEAIFTINGHKFVILADDNNTTKNVPNKSDTQNNSYLRAAQALGPDVTILTGGIGGLKAADNTNKGADNKAADKTNPSNPATAVPDGGSALANDGTGTATDAPNNNFTQNIKKIAEVTGLTVTGSLDEKDFDSTHSNTGVGYGAGIRLSAGKTETISSGKALTLQIGDTADSFNQMKVSVGNMHTYAMGTGKTTLDGKEVEVTKTIADIDIGTQEGAQEAIGSIRNAINYVSSVRGDLGAIQNRLDHTGNNLSVMAENIQDAESTIRDTDVAAEMMKYVKNNILVQSAQAMLAQANQVPQGVLQLLG